MTKLQNEFADPDIFAKSRKTTSSRKLYAVALRAFARHIEIPYEELPTYPSKAKLTDLTSFALDRSAGTRKGYMSVVKCWLEYNEVTFTKKQLDEIRVVVRKDDKTKQEPLTIDIIRKMCDVSNLQGRTLFITLLSTGCRIEELLLTELKEVDLEKGTIFLRGDVTKTKNSRHVVLSLEAINILKIWLQERPAYLESSVLRGQFKRGQIFRGDGKKRREIKREDLLFPYTYQTARSLFATAIRKVYNIKTAPDPKHPQGNLRRNWGELYDADTGRGKLHIHSFRGTFRMALKNGTSSEVCEILMGHDGYLQGAYKDIALDDLIAEYRKAEEHVMVYPTDSLKQKLLETTSAEAKNRANIAAMQARIDHLERLSQGLGDMMRDSRIMTLTPEYQQYLTDKGRSVITENTKSAKK